MSTHRIFLLDPEQSIRPASDLPPQVVRALVDEASRAGRSSASLLRCESGPARTTSRTCARYCPRLRRSPTKFRRVRPEAIRRSRRNARSHPEAGVRGGTVAARRGLCLAMAQQERQEPLRHPDRWPGAPVEQHRHRLDQFGHVNRRGRLGPHHSGLRPQLRRRDHRPRPSL